jgi:trans-aconitate methyltransferase
MNIDAFDPEPAGVKAARKLGINAKLSDSDNYNYKVDYYDLIICLNITHHLLLESQEHLFKNIKLGLKKNGILALSIYESINDVSVGSMVESEFEHILKMKQIEKIPYTKGSKKFFYYIYKN